MWTILGRFWTQIISPTLNRCHFWNFINRNAQITYSSAPTAWDKLEFRDSLNALTVRCALVSFTGHLLVLSSHDLPLFGSDRPKLLLIVALSTSQLSMPVSLWLPVLAGKALVLLSCCHASALIILQPTLFLYNCDFYSLCQFCPFTHSRCQRNTVEKPWTRLRLPQRNYEHTPSLPWTVDAADHACTIVFSKRNLVLWCPSFFWSLWVTLVSQWLAVQDFVVN